MPKKPVAVTLRKPQAPADPDTFVAGEKAPAQKRPAPPANPIDAASVVQHGARDYREMTLYLPTEIVRELSFFCMDRNCDVNRVVADAVSKHVDGADPAASVPKSSLGNTLDSLIEQSRAKLEKLNGLWSLRPWVI